MATKTVKTGVTDDKVTLHVPRGQTTDEQQIIIGINGKNYVLPRGKTVKVPYAVALEFHRAQRAEEKQTDRKMELSI